MKRPGCYSSSHSREHDIYNWLVDLIAPAKCIEGTQVKYAVSAQCGGSAVIEVEKPDRAVNQRVAGCNQGIHRTHSQSVERELKCLVRGLCNFPDDV